jgi:hypothetical protein
MRVGLSDPSAGVAGLSLSIFVSPAVGEFSPLAGIDGFTCDSVSPSAGPIFNSDSGSLPALDFSPLLSADLP